MQDSNIPTKIVLPWGASAGSPYIGAIPVASQIGITANAASLTDGFPPMTAQAGGAPRIQDTNGIINLMSAWNRWQAAGGPMYYDNAFSSAIGGYPAGAFLNAISALGNYWISTVDNNTSNPDTGGANWLSASTLPSGKLINIQNLSSSGTYTPTQGTNSIIVEAVGGGGAGGGVVALGAGSYGVGGGGGSGAYLKGWIKSGFSGVSYTIGAGGAGTSAAGGSGGATSFGSFFSLPGGGGGGSIASNTSTAAYATGGNGGSGATISGSVTVINTINGISSVSNAFVVASLQLYATGYGGTNPLGTGGGPGTPGNGTGNGAGGGGKSAAPGTGPFNGGAGSAGVIIVYEFS